MMFVIRIYESQSNLSSFVPMFFEENVLNQGTDKLEVHGAPVW